MNLKHDETGSIRIPSRLFDVSDGMANHEANGGVFPAGWKMENGEIWFPTMQGIAIINPEALIESERDVEVHVESLNYGGNEFTVTDDIVIPPGFIILRSIMAALILKNLIPLTTLTG
ncbi:hypothetical protein [Rhodohalobacter sp.]|uniref:hypothetical protein n=1 Tax=Rhodohalobacter sp. TaxID=1974210 RepID=UPI002ACD9222|nr:hypothetical protein [Rhodohalobacter sp.]MDZ7755433.1 hypothetical protein [Rhodohalobacter sp.]